MSTIELVQNLVAPYGPKLPIEDLVLELNQLYHSLEAKYYDQTHPEVHEQLPPLWAQMLQKVISDSKQESWSILDYGCGTGFEALQILEHLGPSRVRSLTCYDPSPEMLSLCRDKVGSRFKNVRFCSKLPEVFDVSEAYDLVATNSLLHHLPSVTEATGRLEPVIKRDAFWLMGHEPSRRYYRNVECSKVLARYIRQVKLRKLASPKACYRSLQRLLTIGDNPAESAANAAYRKGLFSKRPRASVVSRLVDFNVPHTRQEAACGRGFDFEEMNSDMGETWRLRWVKTYAFMGPFTEDRLPRRWRKEAECLRAMHPLDGANFCSVWSRNDE